MNKTEKNTKVFLMVVDKRKDERFDDIGRAEAHNLCALPGFLVDISMLGCRVRFPANFEVSTEKDVELKILTARKGSSQPITLIAHPQWSRSESDSTEIGFKFLRSPGTRELYKYIEKLALSAAEFEEENEQYELCLPV